MKKVFKMLHTEEIAFIEVFKTQFSPTDPILGNVIGSHYYLIVARYLLI